MTEPTPAIPKKPAVRLPSLDIVRGLAVLMVIANHSDPERLPGMPMPRHLSGLLYWTVHQFGWAGVELFFVLSGYLVSGLLFQDLERLGAIRYRRFWFRRAFKILPSYWALLAVVAALGITGFTSGATAGARLGHAAEHIFLLQNYLDRGVNGPTWTLAVEEHFYLCLPIVLGLLFRWRNRETGRIPVVPFALGICALCLLLRCVRLASGHATPDDFMMSHLRFDSLFIGVLLQYLLRTRTGPIPWLLAAPRRWVLLAALLLISPAVFFTRATPFMFTIGFTLLSFGYALLLLLVVGGGLKAVEQRPSMRTAAWIGRSSYNIYLWQFFVAGLGLPGYVAGQEWLSRLPLPALAIVLFQACVFAACCVAIGALFTELIEAPALRLRERLER